MLEQPVPLFEKVVKKIGRTEQEGNGLEEGKLVHTQHQLLLALRDNVSSFLHMCFCPSLIVKIFISFFGCFLHTKW